MSWKAGRKISYNLMEDTQRKLKNTVSSAGSASIFLSVTLICVHNQMKDWKAAYRRQKHVTLSQPLLSVCGLFPYVDTSLHFSGKAENTSCGAGVKQKKFSKGG